jgi:TonB-dependent SusC/RagA subfamily outer membrane receptor
LLVIDGVPRFGTNTSDGEMRLSDLNPDDIESVTVLKDAAAAAVYGARAANGVLLVQTKRASANQKPKFNYRGQFNLQQATHLPAP